MHFHNKKWTFVRSYTTQNCIFFEQFDNGWKSTENVSFFRLPNLDYNTFTIVRRLHYKTHYIIVGRIKKWPIFLKTHSILQTHSIIGRRKKYAILYYVRPQNIHFLFWKCISLCFFDGAEILSLNSSWISQPNFKSWFSKGTKVYSFSHLFERSILQKSHSVMMIKSCVFFTNAT